MFPIFENLRGFFNSRPPLVLFMICLGSFAIALITLAYLVKVKDIKNPDVSEDWNTFLEKFSSLDFCSSNNSSADWAQLNSTGWRISYADVSPADIIDNLNERLMKSWETHPTSAKLSKRDVGLGSTQLHIVPMSTKNSPSSSTPPNTAPSDVEIVNVTVVLNMEVSPAKELLGLPLSSTQFMTILKGKMFQLKGDLADREMVVTVTFPSNLSKDSCDEWVDGVCTHYLLSSCVSFYGPAALFPRTRKPEKSDVCQAAPSDSSSRILLPSKHSTSSDKSWCHQGSWFSTYYSIDESLTVLLSLQDRSLINLHLMRTSYFLFVMVVTLFCYAMIKGRPAKTKVVNIPYVEKVPAGP